ncbi:MAG TPA: iron-containing alcohol dehydrogenase, partial [Candidatus Omnitrophota bacterium]|nr:iron-containing alcohol dehydrogenase [Candidatus Omnitrophota bacterium]
TYAVVDSRLTLSMPASVTASTGFDALSQAIESFWSVRHNPTSDIHALRAIPLIIQSLKRAVDHSGDLEARSSMALAATEAGLAIAHTATTAVHSVSYPITTYFGVPHGHACALTLSSFIDFNQDAFPEGREKVLWNALQCKNAREASEKVDALMTGTGLERRLSRLGIDKPGIETIVKNGFRPDRVKNNPRELTQAELEKILLRIF